MNTELFKKINKSIQPVPGEVAYEQFSMSTWEDEASCGTTRCIGGWAIFHATGGKPLYASNGRGYHDDVIALADRYGVHHDGNETMSVEALAGRLLGLGGTELELFYSDEEVAAEFTALAAEGLDEEAREVLRRERGDEVE